MRILVAAGQWFPDRVSGYARVVTETAKGLAERGHEVTVLVPRVPGRPLEERRGGLTVRREVRRSALPLTFTDIWETRRLAARLQTPVDVAVAHDETQALGLLSARLGQPLVLVYHAPAPLELRFERTAARSRARQAAMAALELALARIEATAVARSARILALSDYTKALLCERYPQAAARVRRVSGGVDVEWFSPASREEVRSRLGIGSDQMVLFTARRLEPRMGLENLLAAVGLLRRALPVTLAVAGTGSLAGVLRARVKDLRLEQTVRLLGRVSESELRAWYRAADLFVLPTVAYEGFGLATVEALACGTPVVGTPVGATPEILAPLDPDLVAASVEPSDLAAAIERALGKRDNGLRERCRAYACARFAWTSVLPGWEGALADLA
jgi:glycosyltransferase involved in cell wall biosynthesis